MTEPVSRWIDGPVDVDESSFRTRLGLTPVIVELVPWGDDAANGAELVVRPARRPIFTWSARRTERYFDLAHALADSVCMSLQQEGYRRSTRVRTGGQGGTNERRTGKRVVAASA